ncbi:MAG: DUF4340 domain-containing protein, partial [Deltaproteobacteria bacterium]|nr:DUF4340 domain-containing protein [Deltaproteobacteria bacterium]
TSPGYRKVHLRLDNEKEVYAVNFESHKIQTGTNFWRDTDILGIKKEAVKEITINDIKLVQNNSAWKLQGLKEDEDAITEKTEELVLKITTLGFADVLGTKENSDYSLSHPALDFSVLIDDKNVSYKFSKHKKENHYVLKVSTLPFYFKIDEITVKELLGFKREVLVKKKSPPVNETDLKPQDDQPAITSPD